MPNTFNPGCNCCGDECPALLSSELDDSPITKLQDAETDGQKVIGKIELPDNSEGQLYLGYQSGTDYLYVECRTDSTSGAEDGALRIGYVSSGANTTLLEIDPYPIAINDFLFGSYANGMLVGGYSAKTGIGTLANITGHLAAPATAPGTLVGASEFLTYSGLIAGTDYTSRAGGDCPSPFYTCCYDLGDAYSRVEIPEEITLTVDAGASDSWTGSYVLPLIYNENGCAWGFPSGTGPFSYLVVFAEAPGSQYGLEVTAIEGGTIFGFGRPSGSGLPAAFKSCIDWSSENLPIDFGSNKSGLQPFVVDV